MKLLKDRIVFLDYLRLIACFMVMIIHAVEPYYINFSNGDLSIATKSDAIWVCLFEGFARSCVPLFVIASCYLLFPLKVEAGRFFSRRFSRILIPFIIWSLFKKRSFTILNCLSTLLSQEELLPPVLSFISYL